MYNDDVEETITLSHLIYGRRILTLHNEHLDPDEELDSVKLSKKTKYIKRLTEHFKSRWKSEYFPESNKSHKMKKEKQSIQLGDIVIIEEHTIKRQNWKLGKVTKLLKGDDDLIRSAVVETNNSLNKTNFGRPIIERLYPLEIHTNIDTNEKNDIEVEINRHTTIQHSLMMNEQLERQHNLEL